MIKCGYLRDSVRQRLIFLENKLQDLRELECVNRVWGMIDYYVIGSMALLYDDPGERRACAFCDIFMYVSSTFIVCRPVSVVQ